MNSTGYRFFARHTPTAYITRKNIKPMNKTLKGLNVSRATRKFNPAPKITKARVRRAVVLKMPEFILGFQSYVAILRTDMQTQGGTRRCGHY